MWRRILSQHSSSFADLMSCSSRSRSLRSWQWMNQQPIRKMRMKRQTTKASRLVILDNLHLDRATARANDFLAALLRVQVLGDFLGALDTEALGLRVVRIGDLRGKGSELHQRVVVFERRAVCEQVAGRGYGLADFSQQVCAGSIYWGCLERFRAGHTGIITHVLVLVEGGKCILIWVVH